MTVANHIDDNTALNDQVSGNSPAIDWPHTAPDIIVPGNDSGFYGSISNSMIYANQPYPSWAQGAGQPRHEGAGPFGTGEYASAKLVVFGDLLSDNGNTAAVEEALGQTTSYLAAPYSPTGDFSDGPKWTTDLAQSLGLQQENFAYEGATGGMLGDAYNRILEVVLRQRPHHRTLERLEQLAAAHAKAAHQCHAMAP